MILIPLIYYLLKCYCQYRIYSNLFLVSLLVDFHLLQAISLFCLLVSYLYFVILLYIRYSKTCRPQSRHNISCLYWPKVKPKYFKLLPLQLGHLLLVISNIPFYLSYLLYNQNIFVYLHIC